MSLRDLGLEDQGLVSGHSGTFSICRSSWGNQHTLGFVSSEEFQTWWLLLCHHGHIVSQKQGMSGFSSLSEPSVSHGGKAW